MNSLLDNIALGLLILTLFMIIFLIISIYRNYAKTHYIYATLLFIPFLIAVLSGLLLGGGLVYPKFNTQDKQENIGYITHTNSDETITYIQTSKKYTIAINRKSKCIPDNIDKKDEIKLVSYLHGNQKIKFPVENILISPICDIISINKL